MALSVYVHIPYCLQRCRYCDFTTFEQREILPPDQYVNWVLQEIRQRHALWNETAIETLYFGGGTPSLLPPHLIVTICAELAKVGLRFQDRAEITLEINPATLTEEHLNQYLEAGFNRFSVGAQTFNDELLKRCGRKHDAADTRATLTLLRKYNVNYSFDLLFALPGQTSADLDRDLDEVRAFAPPHLSAYCLTVPEGHPMNKGRPLERQQIAMFATIEHRLREEVGLEKYEISNFARPGFESRHNLAYWLDASYWGIGLSSHSYSAAHGDFGLRFWNPKSLTEYGHQVAQPPHGGFEQTLPADQWERLQEHEAATDFCHISLRMARGLSREAMHRKFRSSTCALIERRLAVLQGRQWLNADAHGWSLTAAGQLISNQVFAELTFLAREMPDATPRPLVLSSAH